MFENDNTLGTMPIDSDGGGYDDGPPVHPIHPIDPVFEPPIFPPDPVDPPIPTDPPVSPPFAPLPPPSWAVGTFYGSASGLPIVLTISAAGIVTENVNGSISTGQLLGTTLQMGNAQATVSQLSNGIRTANSSQSIDYFTTPPATSSGTSSPPVYTVPPAVIPPVGSSPPTTKTPPTTVSPAGTTSPVPAGTMNIGGLEIDETTLLIGGGLILAIVLLS